MSSRYAASAPSRAEDELQAAQRAEQEAKYCQVDQCRSHYPGHGRPKVRGRADVVFTNGRGEQVRLCQFHYLERLYAAGQGQLSDITGRQLYITPENVKAHWQRIDIADSAAATLSGLQENFR
jgi:hypothetical protein